jgi:hypothetical protein
MLCISCTRACEELLLEVRSTSSWRGQKHGYCSPPKTLTQGHLIWSSHYSKLPSLSHAKR